MYAVYTLKYALEGVSGVTCFTTIDEQLYSCMTVSIWLYNEFSSRNLLRRKGMMLWFKC